MESSCSVDGCDGKHKGHGLCNRHYQYFKAHGVPFRTDLDRFWEKVDRRGPDECWPWLAALSGQGYGKFSADNKTNIAPRWLLGALRGEPLRWDDEVQEAACHHCDNPICVNPGHLYVGTLSANNQDAHDRGRAYTPAVRTHCRNGHAYEGENLSFHAEGYRVCLICQRATNAKWRAKMGPRRNWDKNRMEPRVG
jgi:hypothetical protein